MRSSANEIYQIKATAVSLLSRQGMTVWKHDSITSGLTKTFIRLLCFLCFPFWHLIKNEVLYTIVTNGNILILITRLSFFVCRAYLGQRRRTTHRGLGTTTRLSTWSCGRDSASLKKSTSMTWTTICPPLTCRLTAENVSNCFAPRRHSSVGNVTALWSHSHKTTACLRIAVLRLSYEDE